MSQLNDIQQFDVDDNDQLRVSNVAIGKLHSPEIIKFLDERVQYVEMTKQLKDRLFRKHYLNDRCPHCGHQEFHLQAKRQGMRFGFCLSCQTRLTIDNENRWAEVKNDGSVGREGYVVIEPVLPRSQSMSPSFLMHVTRAGPV